MLIPTLFVVQWAILSFLLLAVQQFSEALSLNFRPPLVDVSNCDNELKIFVGRRKTALFLAGGRSQVSKNGMVDRWFPTQLVEDGDSDKSMEGSLASRNRLEALSLNLAAQLIRRRLEELRDENYDRLPVSSQNKKAYILAKGRFRDLTCTLEGEKVLENLFNCEEACLQDDAVIRGSVMALQSLLILGTQLGVTGSPDQLQNSVAHLLEANDEMEASRDVFRWDASSVRRLKHRIERAAGIQLLAELKRKRTPQGAYDLLVELGAWEKHEDLALLRSGFSLRFSDAEMEAARQVRSSFP